jgi:microcystin degradation protein MlrC
VPTPLRRFGSPNVPRGAEAHRLFKGTGTGIGGFLDVEDEAGMEIVTPIAGNAAPSGPVEANSYAVMSYAICKAISQACVDRSSRLIQIPALDAAQQSG